MRNLLLSSILSLVVAQGLAQPTLHAFVLCNSNDSLIGKSCDVDYNNIRSEIDLIGKSLKIKVNKIYLRENDFMYEIFEDKLKSIRVDTSDIVFFYVSSHGRRDPRQQSDFPEFLIPTKVSAINFVGASVIHNRMKEFKARLTISIIDACNSYAKVSSREVKLFNKTYKHESEQTTFEGLKTEHKLDKLFNDIYGDLIVTSSEPGKASIATNQGSIFSNCFIEALHYYLRNDRNEQYLNWDNILTRSRSGVIQNDARAAPVSRT